ncbi:MAG: prolyl-tRNA synthetase associated domain-containing protein [Nanoarchaeota archaeon]|nr:prolyl-tRNA synthetase associated domain-containing protein [Nanoarchaeota archaeon]
MEIKNHLVKLGLSFKEFKHLPVYTCEEAERYNQDIKGIHSKNLFIKDKKSKIFYLVILPASKQLDMNKLGGLLNDKIKFANEEDLKNILGLNKGAVSPFGLINDKENKVQIVIDKEVWNSEFVGFHPNINTETLELTKEDFHKFIKSLKNKLIII